MILKKIFWDLRVYLVFTSEITENQWNYFNLLHYLKPTLL